MLPIQQVIKSVLSADTALSSTSAKIAPMYLEDTAEDLIVYETSENVRRSLGGNVTKLKFFNIKISIWSSTELQVRNVQDLATSALCNASSSNGVIVRSCRPLQDSDAGTETVQVEEDDAGGVKYSVETNYIMQCYQ